MGGNRKKKKSHEWQISEAKSLEDAWSSEENGQSAWRTTVDSVATGHYKPAMQKTVSKHAMRPVADGLQRHRVPLLSADSRKPRPQFTQTQQRCEKRKLWGKTKKTVSGLMSHSFCHDFDGGDIIWRERCESLYPSSLMPIVPVAAAM